MQTIFKKQKASITIFISLIFTILLSLLLILVEGTQIGATKVQAKLVAELAMDSCMAEYHQALWKNYHVLYIDDSYGTSKGSMHKLAKHLQTYVEKNAKQELLGCTSFLRLQVPYLEIDDVAFATDEGGKVWKAQAVNYMKTAYGMDMFSNLIDEMEEYTDGSFLSLDVMSMIDNSANQVKSTRRSREEEEQQKLDEQREASIASAIQKRKEELEAEGLEMTAEDYANIEDDHPRQTVDFGGVSDGRTGISLSWLTDTWDSYRGKEILYLVAPHQEISDKKLTREELVSYRMKNQSIKEGASIDTSFSFPEEILFQEYLYKHYGTYRNPHYATALSYEMEYILSGHLSDEANLRAYCEKLLALRMAANLTYLETKDTTKKQEALLVATGISIALGAPKAAEPMQHLLLGIWALAESCEDVKLILQGEKIALMKTSEEWNLSLQSVLAGEQRGKGSKQTLALDYDGYMRLMLFVLAGKNKAPRSMDLAEQNIRHKEHIETFRLDHCIYSFRAHFGFEDSKKHSVVFSRKRSYE